MQKVLEKGLFTYLFSRLKKKKKKGRFEKLKHASELTLTFQCWVVTDYMESSTCNQITLCVKMISYFFMDCMILFTHYFDLKYLLVILSKYLNNLTTHSHTYSALMFNGHTGMQVNK